MARNVGAAFFPFERSRAYNLVQSTHIHIQISLCKPLYLRTFKRVFVCFLFRRVIMCAFDHISYYGQCNHFLYFLFHHPHFQHSIRKCWRRALSHTEHRHENGNKENSMSNVVCFTFIPKSFHQYLFSVRCISVFVCRLALYIYIWLLLPLLSSPSYSVVVAVVIVTVWTIVCSAHWPTPHSQSEYQFEIQKTSENWKYTNTFWQYSIRYYRENVEGKHAMLKTTE